MQNLLFNCITFLIILPMNKFLALFLFFICSLGVSSQPCSVLNKLTQLI